MQYVHDTESNRRVSVLEEAGGTALCTRSRAYVCVMRSTAVQTSWLLFIGSSSEKNEATTQQKLAALTLFFHGRRGPKCKRCALEKGLPEACSDLTRPPAGLRALPSSTGPRRSGSSGKCRAVLCCGLGTFVSSWSSSRQRVHAFISGGGGGRKLRDLLALAFASGTQTQTPPYIQPGI